MTRKSFIATLLAGPLALLASIGLVKRKPVVLCLDEILAAIATPHLLAPEVVARIRRLLITRNYVIYNQGTGKTSPPGWLMARDGVRSITVTERTRQIARNYSPHMNNVVATLSNKEIRFSWYW